MLNYETLLSSYDDKLTLMQWLKKVEAALKDASAVSFNVNKRGDATLTFSVVFEDGSELETGPITLEQGESVQGATIRNGHLILTLTNGDVLDAGNLFNGNVTLSGNLSVSGTISGNMPVLTTAGEKIDAQKPVVEVMTGYSFAQSPSANATQNVIYASACKNGNKLTLVIFQEITIEGAVPYGYVTLGRFNVPAAVGNKIFPYELGGQNIVDIKDVLLIKGITDTAVSKRATLTKAGTGGLISYMYGVNDLELNTKYICRFECTILLSENLAA